MDGPFASLSIRLLFSTPNIITLFFSITLQRVFPFLTKKGYHETGVCFTKRDEAGGNLWKT